MPDEAVISANRRPSTFLNIRFGTRVARLGSPVRQIHVEPAVIVEVGEVAAHRHENHGSSPRSSVVSSNPLPSRLRKSRFELQPMRLAQKALDHVPDVLVIAGGEDVEPAVVVVVPSPA